MAGTWKDLTDNVNSMASNLTGQVRNIAEVTMAVASGDLSQKITADAKGEILELKNTINTMVDQFNAFSVGGDPRGPRGGHRRQTGRPGRKCPVWPAPGRTSPTTSIRWPRNLTAQVRNIAEVTTAVAHGDLSRKITVDVKGEILRVEEHHQHDGRSAQRLCIRSQPSGPRGRYRRQAGRPGAGSRRGRHLERPDRQRQLDGLEPHGQVRNIAEVTTAVANGDLSKKITVDVRAKSLS